MPVVGDLALINGRPIDYNEQRQVIIDSIGIIHSVLYMVIFSIAYRIV
jgi:hypothetical protein